MIKLDTILKDKKQNKKKAFTLVEVMLMLLVLSLIIASSTVMITRKHKLKPRKAIHGQYGCFKVKALEADGSDKKVDGKQVYYTHEYMQSGQSILYHHTNDPSFGEDERRDNVECSPELPKSTSYLLVNVIGGGGAGGNANYKYKEPIWNSDAKNLSLVSENWNGDSKWSNAYMLDKKTKGNDAEDKKLTGGISKKYINEKYGEEYFSWDLFHYLIKDYFKIRVFAYDFTGAGEDGAGVEATPAKKRDENYNLPSSTTLTPVDAALYDNVSFECRVHPTDTTYNSYHPVMFKTRGTDPDDSALAHCLWEVFDKAKTTHIPMIKRGENCVVGGDPGKSILENCPALHSIQQLVLDGNRTCPGGQSGSGALFTSDVYPYNEGMFAITGRRYYNTASDGDKDTGKDGQYAISAPILTWKSWFKYNDVIDRRNSNFTGIVYDMGDTQWYNPIRVAWQKSRGNTQCSLDEKSALRLLPSGVLKILTTYDVCSEFPDYKETYSYDGHTGTFAELLDNFLHKMEFGNFRKDYVESPYGTEIYENADVIETSSTTSIYIKCPVVRFMQDDLCLGTLVLKSNEWKKDDCTYKPAITTDNKEECYISTSSATTPPTSYTIPFATNKRYDWVHVYPAGYEKYTKPDGTKEIAYFPLDYQTLNKFYNTGEWFVDNPLNTNLDTIEELNGKTNFTYKQAYHAPDYSKFPVDPTYGNSTFDNSNIDGGIFNQPTLKNPKNEPEANLVKQTVRRESGRTDLSIYAFGIYKIPKIDYDATIGKFRPRDGAYPYFGTYKHNNYMCDGGPCANDNSPGTRRQRMDTKNKDYGVKLHSGTTTYGPRPLKHDTADNIGGEHGVNLSRYQVEHLLNPDATINTNNKSWVASDGYTTTPDADKTYTGSTADIGSGATKNCPRVQPTKAMSDQWPNKVFWGQSGDYSHGTYSWVDYGVGYRHNTSCIGFMGYIYDYDGDPTFYTASNNDKRLYTKHGRLHDILGTANDKFKCPYYNSGVHRGEDISTVAEFIYENEFALRMKYYYQTRSMTYGAPGEPGSLHTMFTRTFSNTKVFAIPADGTEPLKIEPGLKQDSETDLPAKTGKSSRLWYSCTGEIDPANPDGACLRSITAAGGAPGEAWIPDPVTANGKYKTELVKLLNTDGLQMEQTMYCTSNGPNGEREGYEEGPLQAANDPFSWCSNGINTYLAEKSKFSATASMIDIPTVALNVPDFTPNNIGRGGNGGYVANTCFVTPQFFTIENLNYYGSDQDGKISGTSNVKDLGRSDATFPESIVNTLTSTSSGNRYRYKIKLYTGDKNYIEIPVGDVLGNFQNIPSLGHRGYTKFADIVQTVDSTSGNVEYTIGLSDDTKNTACKDATSKMTSFKSSSKRVQNAHDHFAYERQATAGYPGAVLIIW